MTAADPTAAVAGFLLDQVGDLTDGRVFRPELPKTEDQHMPRAAIVVSPAGGPQAFGDSYLPVDDPRVDVRCYGSTALEGQNLARACGVQLKRMRPAVWEGVMLHSATVSAGVMPLIDVDTLWPFSLVSFQVMCEEDRAA